MKKFYVIFILLVSIIAQADMVSRANINAVCGDEVVGAFSVQSDVTGSTIQFEEITTLEGEQLIASTEGMDPAIQVAQNGYNISFYGGAFQDVFYSEYGLEDEGPMTASVVQFDENGAIFNSYETECYGTYSFESLFNFDL